MTRWLTRSLVPLLIMLAACSPAATPTPTSVPPTSEPPPAESTPEIQPTAAAADAPPADSTPEMTAESTTSDAPPAESTPDAASDSESAAGPVARINQQNTSLRAGPGTSYARVATAGAGDEFPVTGRFGEAIELWYQITLPDGSTAWAWSRVAELQPADAEVPVVEPPPAS